MAVVRAVHVGQGKEQINRRKHGVDFKTVPQVFADPGRVLLADRSTV